MDVIPGLVCAIAAAGIGWLLVRTVASRASSGTAPSGKVLRDGERVISAQFQGRCSDCGRPTLAGTQILWVRGSPVRHEDCAREGKISDADVLLRATDKLDKATTPAARTRVTQEMSAKLVSAEARSHLLQLATQRGIDADAQADSDLLTKTIAKLEAAKGQATRLRVLEEAVALTRNAETHHRLVLEASRINARAILDKVDGLKTVSAKRRHIEQAIADIRADKVPDALQGDELSWLADALKSLDEEQK